MDRELSVKMTLDNSEYIESLQQIISRTYEFRNEIDKVKDKLEILSSTKVETEIKVNTEESLKSIKEIVDTLKELEENSSIALEVKSNGEDSKNIFGNLDGIENMKNIYKSIMSSVDEDNTDTLTDILGDKGSAKNALEWIKSQNSSVNDEEIIKGIAKAREHGLDYKKLISTAQDTSAATGTNFEEVIESIIEINSGKSGDYTKQFKNLGLDKKELKGKGKRKNNSKGKNKRKSQKNPTGATSEIIGTIGEKYKGASKKAGKNAAMKNPLNTIKKTKVDIGKVFKASKGTGQIKKSGGILKKFSGNVIKGFKDILKISKLASGGIMKSIGQVFSMILTNPIGAAIAVIIAVVVLLYKAWTENWGGIKSKIEPIVEPIKKAIGSISPIIEKIIDIVSKFASTIMDVWNKITGFFENPIKGTFDFIAKFTGIGKAGKNALGTSFWGGGLTWVGENGPELIDLPSGSQVFDNRTSKNMTGSNISIPKLADTIVVREDADIDKIANTLARKLKNTGLNMA
ncbi:hypothetical protein [Clostridium rectalis]|uniref:hypothetical protein n=1 Tax=Clostridium rectalis TaxID=2040295 RepID=UPI000F644F91|nr:hypothetical protein [Clostridium rectalis]